MRKLRRLSTPPPVLNWGIPALISVLDIEIYRVLCVIPIIRRQNLGVDAQSMPDGALRIKPLLEKFRLVSTFPLPPFRIYDRWLPLKVYKGSSVNGYATLRSFRGQRLQHQQGEVGLRFLACKI